MLKMAQIQYIKYLYESQEESLNKISEITGCNYRTVQKYAYMENWSPEKLPNTCPQNYPILGEYIPIIDKWLEEDRKVPRKQRHTVIRIYNRLQKEHGFKGSYSSVKKYVRKKKYVMKQEKGGYLPLEHPKGWAQVDFGEFMYYDRSGKECQGYELLLTFPYSNKGYVQAYPSCNQECLLSGLQRIFEYIGGVPIRLRADNMTTAVVQILQGKERELTDGFSRFMLHYRFEADFCNPAAGNEKGNVENKVGYARRNALVPVPTIDSFEEFNEKLLRWCEEDSERPHYIHKVPIESLWQEEKNCLLTLPEYPFSVFRYEALKVNKYGMVTVDTNRYGLSPALNGEIVQAKIFYDHIEFYHDHQSVGEYRRSYGQNTESLDWRQYLQTLAGKPGGTEYTRVFRQMPENWQSYLQKADSKERKSAIRLLYEMTQEGNDRFCESSLEMAIHNGRCDSDSIRQCYYLLSRDEKTPEPLKLESAPVTGYMPDLSAYDCLTGGDVHE